MLILKAYVNSEKIDEIHIQNIGMVEDGLYMYRLRKPVGTTYNNVRFFHYRKDGWRALAKTVLSCLENECKEAL